MWVTPPAMVTALMPRRGMSSRRDQLKPWSVPIVHGPSEPGDVHRRGPQGLGAIADLPGHVLAPAAQHPRWREDAVVPRAAGQAGGRGGHAPHSVLVQAVRARSRRRPLGTVAQLAPR